MSSAQAMSMTALCWRQTTSGPTTIRWAARHRHSTTRICCRSVYGRSECFRFPFLEAVRPSERACTHRRGDLCLLQMAARRTMPLRTPRQNSYSHCPKGNVSPDAGSGSKNKIEERRMEFAEINGGGMRYELSGTGERTIVLVHEMGGTLESWDGVAPLFATSRQVLRYDFRGSGLSQKVRGELRSEEHTSELQS